MLLLELLFRQAHISFQSGPGSAGQRRTNHAGQLLQLFKDATHEPGGGGLPGAACDAHCGQPLRRVVQERRCDATHRLQKE